MAERDTFWIKEMEKERAAAVESAQRAAALQQQLDALATAATAISEGAAEAAEAAAAREQESMAAVRTLLSKAQEEGGVIAARVVDLEAQLLQEQERSAQMASEIERLQVRPHAHGYVHCSGRACFLAVYSMLLSATSSWSILCTQRARTSDLLHRHWRRSWVQQSQSPLQIPQQRPSSRQHGSRYRTSSSSCRPHRRKPRRQELRQSSCAPSWPAQLNLVQQGMRMWRA